MDFYWILLMILWLPIAGMAFKHFWGQRKPGKPRVVPFPFPILSHGKFYEAPTFRAVDWSQEPRNKKFDWPQA